MVEKYSSMIKSYCWKCLFISIFQATNHSYNIYVSFVFQNYEKYNAATGTLQKVKLPSLDYNACVETFEIVDYNIQLCAGGEKGKKIFLRFLTMSSGQGPTNMKFFFFSGL